ncbi:protein kinase domain-containing protein [Neorhodopirellula lusitana]|nr:protein kinase [Neorhodopirellula lusitana]
MLDDEWLLEEFESAWRSDGEPSIDEYLERGIERGLPESQTLNELVRIDMEYRFAREDGSVRSVEDYRRHYTQRLPLTADLFEDEIRLRRRFGRTIDVDAIRARHSQEQFANRDEYQRFLSLLDLQGVDEQQQDAVTSSDEDTSKSGVSSDPDETHVKDSFDSGRANEEVWGDLDKRYERRRLLGKGSFGVVWEAFDRQLRRRVAVKVLSSRGPMSDVDLQLFVREARSAASLQHPHLLTIHDVIVHDQFVALVTQLIDGVTLDRWWDEKDEQSKSVLELAQILRDISDAVHHAHLAGLIHCDLKPRNILVDKDGKANILDFGLAIRRDGDQPVAGVIAGTPTYMSPEQTWGESHHLDGRTDVWSIGAMMYQLLTGKAPFVAATTAALFEMIQTCDLVPMGQIRDSIPLRLQQISQRCLMKRTTDRYETAGQLAQELGGFIDEIMAESEDSGSTMATFRESRFRRLSGRVVSLPWRPIELFGREETIQSVTEMLNAGCERLVTLTGGGGVGKTETAIAIAHRMSESFEGDVVWVDLASVQEEEQFAAAVLSAMQVMSTANMSSLHLVTQALAVRGPILLILDNLEQAVAVLTPLVVQWLAQCPDLVLLVTSQLPLRVRGEHIVLLNSLDIDHSGDAIDLFIQRAKVASDRFVCDDKSRNLVASLCRLVDGNPLAIELAAARMGLMSLRDLHGRLLQSFNILRSSSVDRPARHQTLQDVVRWSFNLLSDQERAAAMRLAIWPSPLSTDLAERMLVDHSVDPFLVLEELRQRQLIRVAESDEQVVYSVSTVVQRYVLETIEQPQRGATCICLIESVLQSGLRGEPSNPGLATNLWSAIEFLLDHPEAVETSEPAGAQEHLAEAMLVADSLAGDDWGLPLRIQRLRRCEPLGTVVQRCELQVRLADALRRVGQTEGAERLGTQVLGSLEDLASESVASIQNKANRLLSLLAFRKGRSQQAIDLLNESLQSLDTYRFPDEKIDTLLELAEFHRRVGNFDNTRSLLSQIEALLDQESSFTDMLDETVVPSPEHKARQLRLMIESGKLALQSGRIEESLQKFSQAVSQADTGPLLPWIGQALLGRAAARAESGDIEGAEKDYARSEKLSRRLGDLPTLAQSINNRAIAYDDLGEAQRCVDTLDEPLAIYRRLDDSMGIAIATAAKAAAVLQLGNPQETIRLLESEEVSSHLAPSSIHQGIRLGDLASAWFLEGDLQRAEEACRHSLTILDELGVRDSAERLIYTVLFSEILDALDHPSRSEVGQAAARLAAIFRDTSDPHSATNTRSRVALALKRFASTE